VIRCDPRLDPKWPSYAQFHDDYTQALADAAAAVGGAGGN
jgi:hypothetical protein